MAHIAGPGGRGIGPKGKKSRHTMKSTVGGISGNAGQVRVPATKVKSPNPLKSKQLISTMGRVYQQSMPRPNRPKKKEVSATQTLSHDTARRLVLAETVAQKTVNGTITDELKDEEYRVSLYLDAGLLGIKREDMAEMINKGRCESDIVQHYYDQLLVKNGNGKRPATDSLLPPVKKSHTDKTVALSGLGALTDEGILKALRAIGAA